MKIFASAFFFCVSCATVPEPLPEDTACIDALRVSRRVLNTLELVQCSHTTDCALVDPLIAGKCGVAANRSGFEARNDIFLNADTACSAHVQVASACPAQQVACVAGTCQPTASSVIESECADAELALRTAIGGSNQCDTDDQCALVVVGKDSLAANQSIAKSDLVTQRQYACGAATRLSVRSDVKALEDVACVDHRCKAVVPSDGVLTRPLIDKQCVANVVVRMLNKYGTQVVKPGMILVKTVVSADGVVSKFTFIGGNPTTREAQVDVANHIHACHMEPATWRGKKVSVSYVFNFSLRTP